MCQKAFCPVEKNKAGKRNKGCQTGGKSVLIK